MTPDRSPMLDRPGGRSAGTATRTLPAPLRSWLALSRIDLPGGSGAPAVLHAIRWLAGTQGRDGCWERSVLSTVLAVQALAAHGACDGPALRRGVVWLLRAQRADGAWVQARMALPTFGLPPPPCWPCSRPG